MNYRVSEFFRDVALMLCYAMVIAMPTFAVVFLILGELRWALFCSVTMVGYAIFVYIDLKDWRRDADSREGTPQ